MQTQNIRLEDEENIQVIRLRQHDRFPNERGEGCESGDYQVLVVLQKTSEALITLCLAELEDNARVMNPQAIKNIVEQARDLAFIQAAIDTIKERKKYLPRR